MEELDDAGTYYNMGLRRITTAGVYNYMCTRNNNFSNRSQKGILLLGIGNSVPCLMLIYSGRLFIYLTEQLLLRKIHLFYDSV